MNPSKTAETPTPAEPSSSRGGSLAGLKPQIEILHHPQPERVGQVCSGWGGRAMEALVVGRHGPLFETGEGARPLGDRFISRA